jgi:hypothetical protein
MGLWSNHAACFPRALQLLEFEIRQVAFHTYIMNVGYLSCHVHFFHLKQVLDLYGFCYDIEVSNFQ